jgi:hypothetical protein
MWLVGFKGLMGQWLFNEIGKWGPCVYNIPPILAQFMFTLQSWSALNEIYIFTMNNDIWKWFHHVIRNFVKQVSKEMTESVVHAIIIVNSVLKISKNWIFHFLNFSQKSLYHYQDKEDIFLRILVFVL